MKINSFKAGISNTYPKITADSKKMFSAPNMQQYVPLSAIEGKYFLQNINFTGGYSMSLRETLENLPVEDFPPGVRELAIKTLKDGNPKDKTLIDIHRERYGAIKEMDTLDEVKEKFPELSGVISDEDITYNGKSLIGDIKNGDIEYFDPDEDLALQFLKLYWADGFSLKDITEYTGGKSVLNVLRKLNIPRYSNTYGHVLKFSDKNYNKRMTSEMSERQKEAAISRFERNEGLRIPRGPLSDEHKRKISEGLIKHYSEHPEKLSELSRNQKRYYAEHPEEKERMSRVLNVAWNLREAKSIRKALSKFMKKNLEGNIVFTKDGIMIDGVEPSKLKAFWDRNVWAKTQWSKCMKKSWEIVKNQDFKDASPVLNLEDNRDRLKNGVFEFEEYPKNLINYFKAWHTLSGGNIFDIKNTNAFFDISGNSSLPPVDEFTQTRLVQYFRENPEVVENFKTAQRYALMKLSINLRDMAAEIDERKSTSKEKRQADFMAEIGNYIDTKTCYNDPEIELNDRTLHNIIGNVVYRSCKEGYPAIACLLERNINEIYVAIKEEDSITRLREIFDMTEEEVDKLTKKVASFNDFNASENQEFKIDIYPPSLQRDIKAWGAKNGFDVSKIDSMEASVSMNPVNINEPEEAQKIVGAYIRSGGEHLADIMADTYNIALVKTCGELFEILNDKSIKISKNKRAIMTQIRESIANELNNKGRMRYLSMQELIYEFITTSTACRAIGATNVQAMLLDNAEIAYRMIQSKGQAYACDKLVREPGYIQ